MPRILIKTSVVKELEIVKSGFDSRLFNKLSPPFVYSKLIQFDGCQIGDRVILKVGIPGLTQTWESLITDNRSDQNSWYFTDEGVRLPFPLKSWRHKHIVQAHDKGSLIIDEIDFKTGFIFSDYLFYPFLWVMFFWRKPIYKKYFA